MQDWEGMLLKHSQRGESWGIAKHFIQCSDEFKTWESLFNPLFLWIAPKQGHVFQGWYSSTPGLPVNRVDEL